MNTNKAHLTILFIFLLAMCGCENQDAVSNYNFVESTDDLSYLDVSSDEQSDLPGEKEDSQVEKDIYRILIGECDARINSREESGNILLNFDCDVKLPVFETGELYTCFLDSEKVNANFLSKLSEQYFGKIIDIDYDGVVYSSEVEESEDKYKIYGCEMVYSVTGSKKNLCFWESNVYPNINSSELSSQVDDAITKCDEFIDGIGLTNYRLNNVQAFSGKELGEEFLRLRYSICENGILVSNYDACKAEIYYTDTGIYTVSGSLFNISEGEAIDDYVSLESAIEILKDKIKLMGILDSENSVFDYVTDQNNLIQQFNIYKITIEYISESGSAQANKLTPAWRFYFGTDGNIDYSRVLAVSIANGDLIVK